MPTSQILSCVHNHTNQQQQSSGMISKPPLPNKPPPPPLPRRPRNTNQFSSGQTNLNTNQVIASYGLAGSSNGNSCGVLNNGSSMGSLNSTSRCTHTQLSLGNPPGSLNHGQRNFNNKHNDTCSSRSSVSSHNSLQHHHHASNHNINNSIASSGNGNGLGGFPNSISGSSIGSSCNNIVNSGGICSHNSQNMNMGYVCSGSVTQHNQMIADGVNCNLNHQGQDSNNAIMIPRGFNNIAQSGNGSCNSIALSSGSHHIHANCSFAAHTKCCQASNGVNSSRTNSSSGNMSNNNGSTPSTSMSRNPLFYNNQNSPEFLGATGVDSINRNHSCTSLGQHPYPHLPLPVHHHHHHHHSNVQSSPNSSLTGSSNQPIDSNVPSCPPHRCGNNSNNINNNTMSQSSMTSSISGINDIDNNPNDQISRPLVGNNVNNNVHSCGHTHRASCNHHNPQASNGFCDHHIQSVVVPQMQPVIDGSGGGCSHSSCFRDGQSDHHHHNCGLTHTNPMAGKSICSSSSINSHPHHLHYHGQDVNANRSSDNSKNDSLLSTTAHTHNLSNSSTTTHTSNVAVKHQPHSTSSLSNRSSNTMCREMKSNCSHNQFEQYGLSSAASTSSATASLSSYQMRTGSEDLNSFYPSNMKGTAINYQALSRLPPLPNAFVNSNMKSRPGSPALSFHSMPSAKSNTISNTNYNNSNNMSIMTTTFLSSYSDQHASSLPPLPPKPTSPNASSSSTQITTVTTSPSLHSQQITRVTSQAGVQNPLPNSDVPPPLPPLNPGGRAQPMVNSLIMKLQSNSSSASDAQHPPLRPPPPPTTTTLNSSFSSLNINAQNLNKSNNNSINFGGGMTEAERKTEALTRQVELELEKQQLSGEPLGVCPKCGNKVMPAQEACKAMKQIYHTSCFVCCECNRTLLGKTFYPVGDKVYCEEDFKYTGHMRSLEKCAACSQPIFNMILPAMGKSYHPKCFKCCVCGQCLDGVPFTIDKENRIYCVEDYHNIFSPKCAACGKSISPIDGTGETVRVVSRNKDYHIDCYCCEDCGLQLTDEEPSQSYPLDNHLLCQQCHINRLSKMQAGLSLN